MNKGIFCGALVSAFAMATAPSFADGALNGTWQGVVDGKAAQFTAQLIITDASAELHFGSPVACKLALKPVGAKSGSQTYTVSNQGGGLCDRYFGGSLVLTGTGPLSMTLRTVKGTNEISSSLEKR